MIRWNRLRIAATAVAFVAALSTGALAAGPASAATSGATATSGKVTAAGSTAAASHATQRIAIRIPAPAGTAAPAYAVICYANIDGPTISGFNLVVAASTTCNYPVTSLIMTVTLYWNNNVWGQSVDISKQTVAGYAQGPCIPGTFYGKLFLEVTWPPGVTGAPTYTTTTNPLTISSYDNC